MCKLMWKKNEIDGFLEEKTKDILNILQNLVELHTQPNTLWECILEEKVREKILKNNDKYLHNNK